MADRDLHEKAKSVKPDQELPERRYWVAILYHHKKPENIDSQEDFLWIKANAVRTTVHTKLENILTSLALLENHH